MTHPFLAYTQKNWKQDSNKNFYMNAHSSIIYVSSKEITKKGSSINKCLLINVVYHTMEYYLAIKNVLIHAQKKYWFMLQSWWTLKTLCLAVSHKRPHNTGNIPNRQISRDSDFELPKAKAWEETGNDCQRVQDSLWGDGN